MAYSDVLGRLVEERNRKNISISEMSRFVGMTWGNYISAEKGVRRLGYYSLLGLCKTSVDMHYVFTGQKCSGDYVDFFTGKEFRELVNVLRIIYAYLCLNNTNGYWNDLLNKISYINIVHINQTIGDILIDYRYLARYRQQKLAELLGIDVKKMRNLETGKTLPDSELLWKIYDGLGIPPMVFLKDKKAMANEISYIMELIGNDKGNWLFYMLQNMMT